MPRLGPISRQDLIRNLRKLGFTGPYRGTRHQLMQRGTSAVRIPNPHRGDIGVPLLRRILQEAGVTVQEWEAL
jgi:hypothetical protein